MQQSPYGYSMTQKRLNFKSRPPLSRSSQSPTFDTFAPYPDIVRKRLEDGLLELEVADDRLVVRDLSGAVYVGGTRLYLVAVEHVIDPYTDE